MTPASIPQSALAPTVNPETKPFWDATLEGKLLVGNCADCGKAHFHPRPFCPLCFSASVTWDAASGKGTIYSVSVLRRGVKEPYALAYVTLDEGCMMATNIVDCDLDAIGIDDKVEVVFVPTDGEAAIPFFRPAR
ncbi:Zn-ribbon domain-containing OB-fold protein [Sphingomonas sp.]|uniref:Zn-ribbon domain-containing OB-fold protein n=1 Tax=Sphingomonas sp. TaxID=28214 RepID=UPI002DD674DC|nr:OB-fold domain-containing protein [Sphingomonas sp.]